MKQMTPDVVVIGAGVIGLTAAVCLAERGQRVEVRTRLGPAETTSAVASAMIGPAIASAGSEAGRRERASIAEFTSLTRVPGTGVTIRRGRLASREPVPAPGDMVSCRPDERPPGFAVAFWATLPLVEMPVYLKYLTERLAAAGGRLERRTVSSLSELAAEAPLIVNCAGLGARELTGDDSLTPSRGQHVIVDNPGLAEFFVEAPFTPSWGGVLALSGPRRARWDAEHHGHPDRTGSRDRRADPAALHRGRTRLAHARVRGHQVGLRPARPAVRLEVEQIGAARCVHNYGHGGSGVTLSWGCAFAAVALLLDEEPDAPCAPQSP